ncbi:Sec23 Sec24 zinc finger Sec23 Sec24 trunk domain [Trypanosoma vivax]|nr:sec24-like transport protein [Trypanosoma vivax]KAH8605745.1 Sec23 Sec24 zinc finger Sec23 Sec24 trunk domain [Trypanosoma vivax]
MNYPYNSGQVQPPNRPQPGQGAAGTPSWPATTSTDYGMMGVSSGVGATGAPVPSWPTTSSVGAGGQSLSQYYDPYAASTTSAGALYSSCTNGTTYPYAQQQQQQQQYAQMQATQYPTSYPQQTAPQYVSAPSVQQGPSTATTSYTGHPLPSSTTQNFVQQQQQHEQHQQEQYYTQQQYGQQSGTSVQNANNAYRPQPAPTPLYARPPPRRAVDLKNVPNPHRDISRYPPNQEVCNSSGQFPPSVCGFIGIDDGNASAKFMRFTTTSVHAEGRMVKESFLPLGAVLAPLCRPLHEREEVPIASGRPPVRCRRCRGYLSCHARFINMGRAWVCPLCEMTNEVEDAMFCNLDSSGRRLDIAERPELRCGSVEYDVDEYPEYALQDNKGGTIPSRPLHYLFVLDVSQKALATFLSDYVDALRCSLSEMARQYPECRVAFITYASTLHFYHTRGHHIEQMIVADVDNPFVPLPFTSLCWLTIGTDLHSVDAFLCRVPEFARDLSESDSAMGAAMQVARLVLTGQHGGRIIITAHKAPQRGIGTIDLRQQHLIYGTSKEKELLRPMEGFWKVIAVACAKDQISCDMHMFADEYCELVTLAQPCHLTNGRLHLFSNYDSHTDATKVRAVLDQVLLEEAGYAGILRVRCSTGLKVAAYHGHFLSQDSYDMDLASIQGSSTFYVEFSHEASLEKSSSVHFQMALLYTTRTGRRRVRVHSVTMPVASSLVTVYDADIEATFMAYMHEAIDNAVNKGLQQARAAAQSRVLKMLTAYRRVCVPKGSSSLLMPSRLRLIPLYVLCLLKADALMEGTTVRIDDRVQKIFHLLTIPVHQCLRYFYPTLYALHTLPDEPTWGTPDSTGCCVMPYWKQLIYDSITSDGAYLLCDEQARLVYLWIGSRLSREVSMELFGTDNVAELGRDIFQHNLGERFRNILQAALLREDGMRRLVVLREGDQAEDAFFRQLKEENEGGSALGYDDLLVQLHRNINKAIS